MDPTPPDDLALASAAAVEDAVRRTGAPRADVRVVAAEAVTWPDAALGCPEPGRMYAQVLTDGVRVVVEAGGRRLDYRAPRGGPVRLCPGSGAPGAGSGGPPDAAGAGGLVDPRPRRAPRGD